MSRRKADQKMKPFWVYEYLMRASDASHRNTPLASSYFATYCAFYVEMMGLIGAGNNPMVGMTVAVAVAIEEASK